MFQSILELLTENKLMYILYYIMYTYTHMHTHTHSLSLTHIYYTLYILYLLYISECSGASERE
jgi:hypothetical protein